MNNSASEISPAWPTRWPPHSFGSGTLLLIGAIVGVTLITFCISLVALLWYISAHHIVASPSNPAILVPGMAAQILVEGAIVAVILIMLPGVAKFSLHDLGFRPLTGGNVLTALVGTVAMVILADGGGSLVDKLTGQHTEQQAVQILKSLHGTPDLAFFAVFAIVLAPFMEEMIFRVFVFNFGLRYWGFWPAALISGALFGLAHLDKNAALPLALGGIALCWVYYRTRNAYASVIAHGLFNALSTFLIIFAPKMAQ